jgi:CO/xanthine dehydrogenase Mo-binding subunit
MMFADTLGIPLESVRPSVVDTGRIGHTDNTAGRRTTFSTGLAAYRAGEDIKRQMCERAAILWEVDGAEVEYRDGGVAHRTELDRRIPFRELSAQSMATGGVIVGQAAVRPGSMVAGSFVACLVDVEVDPDTGKVSILRCTLVQDAGRAIHPSYVEGQMQGGVTQGIGWALHEGYYFDSKGGMSNSSFLDYRIPTAFDLPFIETVIVEVPNPDHPFGVRGIGESSIVSPMAAVSNAIEKAVKIRLRSLPMSPDRVLSAINGKSGLA